MTEWPHQLERDVDILARPETVFRYFTDSSRWAAWWGPGSEIDARPGGRMFIRYPNGIEVAGEVLEVDPPTRIVFSYGFLSGQPMPVGASRVTVLISAGERGTRVSLRHEFADATARDHHVQGWRYQLAVFAVVVGEELAAEAPRLVDGWLAAWSEPDVTARRRLLESVAEADVSFRDRFSLVSGLEDLLPHLTAAQTFMPGLRLERRGTVRQCQGLILADWVARGADGGVAGTGTNVYQLSPDGRLVDVTGFWDPPASS